nr:reverse transcriptase domain-containing protein [Tanacetum cinerariifolium]
MTELVSYLKEGILPADEKEVRKIRLKARQYELMEGILYKRSFLTPWLRCVGPLQAEYVIKEIHEGSCSMHAGPRSVVAKAIRLGYFWPTMHRDAQDMIRKCNDCQIFFERVGEKMAGGGRSYVALLLVVSLILLASFADVAQAKNRLKSWECKPRCTYSMDIKAISVDTSLDSALKIQSDYKEDEIVEVHIPVENKSGHIQVFDQIIPLEWTDSSTSCSTSSSLNGDDDQVEKQACQDVDDTEDSSVTIDSLMAQLKAERLAVCGLYIELDEERNASAIAANQAMAMITKLQEEKVALQTESIQNQRLMDEQAEYDQEVLQLLNELVMKLESDKIELENELEMYKQKFLDYKEKKVKVMPRCLGGSSNTKKECLDDASLSEFKNLGTLEESIVEYGVEKLWILDEIFTKDLNENLVGKSSSKGESLDYHRNGLFHTFDVKGIDEEAEASHSPWSLSSF